jgi:hypothetical protein
MGMNKRGQKKIQRRVNIDMLRVARTTPFALSFALPEMGSDIQVPVCYLHRQSQSEYARYAGAISTEFALIFYDPP